MCVCVCVCVCVCLCVCVRVFVLVNVCSRDILLKNYSKAFYFMELTVS